MNTLDKNYLKMMKGINTRQQISKTGIQTLKFLLISKFKNYTSFQPCLRITIIIQNILMLVTFIMAPFGAILAGLLPIFLISQINQNTTTDKLAISYTIFFDLVFGLFSLFLVANIFRTIYKGGGIKQISLEIKNMKKILAKKWLFHTTLSLGFVGIWIISVIWKVLYSETFLMSKFSCTMIFATALGAIMVNDRFGISKFLSVCVTFSVIMSIADWNIIRAYLKNNENSCVIDSVYMIVLFFLLMYYSNPILNLMMLSINAVLLYVQGYGPNRCIQKSQFISQLLMIKIVYGSLIGIIATRLVINKWFPDLSCPCLGQNQQDETNQQGGDHPSSQQIGASEVQISVASSPLEVRVNNDSGFDMDCSICTFRIQESEQLIQLKCKHIYHNQCIKMWIKKHQSCPLCRRKVRIR